MERQRRKRQPLPATTDETQLPDDLRLFNKPQAAAILKISLKTLDTWVAEKSGPTFIKANPGRGGRVMFRLSDLRAWLDSHAVSTKE